MSEPTKGKIIAAASFDHISVKILLLPKERHGLLLVYIEMAYKLFCTAKQSNCFNIHILQGTQRARILFTIIPGI